IVQRGPGTTRLRTFLVRQGTITPLPQIRKSELAAFLPAWIQQLHETPPPEPPDLRSEQIWLVSHFLFKPHAPGVYLHSSELIDVAVVEKSILQRFAKTTKEAEQGLS